MRQAVVFAMTLALVVQSTGCGGFRRLARDVTRMQRSYLLSGLITNAEDFDADVWVGAVRWTPDGEVVSGVRTKLGKLGLFAFSVEGAEHWYVVSVADLNGDGRYDVGEPAWIHADADGRPAAIVFDRDEQQAHVRGEVRADQVVPEALVESARTFGETQSEETLEEASIPVDFGESVYLQCPVARADDGTCPRLTLKDERFSEASGRRGLWEPLSDPLTSGVGLFVVGDYDPGRTAVLFVYGAGGSAQDWRAFFEAFADGPFQPWFYRYPTGRRLDEMANWLQGGTEILATYLGVERVHVVAHSQGGLVARAFLLKNLAAGRSPYIDTFVSISTPWDGHAMAQKGVDGAPTAIPSWHDLAPGSPFLQGLFVEGLQDRIDHHLIFTYRGSRSLVQEPSNDGAVSVASQLKREAQVDAVGLYGFDKSHVDILSDPDVIDLVRSVLADSE